MKRCGTMANVKTVVFYVYGTLVAIRERHRPYADLL